ncbi:hypothetical protein BU14_0218s0051 [Porphyra umbilicalis]|uniref:Uncharacterized protein n=1 Tax=Porphyra umbilicalis TaxID=2786 RepID=A0A1X6P549_PORUM|nr:hypothetical protein BU14_0218s0051 [Porphyra umbilicalis]|eukprot:OSX75886.1 hypothetical protein BU14_0218s0051 [Porphyra umbilicalis]
MAAPDERPRSGRPTGGEEDAALAAALDAKVRALFGPDGRLAGGVPTRTVPPLSTARRGRRRKCGPRGWSSGRSLPRRSWRAPSSPPCGRRGRCTGRGWSGCGRCRRRRGSGRRRRRRTWTCGRKRSGGWRRGRRPPTTCRRMWTQTRCCRRRRLGMTVA